MVALQLFAVLAGDARAASIDAQAINEAQWGPGKSTKGMARPLLVKLQVLLDRARFSPGEIDGKPGENLDKAIAAYAAAQGAGSAMSPELWQKLNETFKDLERLRATYCTACDNLMSLGLPLPLFSELSP